ncbi:MAG: hypothetical protein MRY74_06580 [Neomegalonema sp.]|nr:hypothetical protein [Neomegalonema sp.]
MSTAPTARQPRPARNSMASWTVTLVSILMAFLASLALAAAIGADRLADKWTGDLAYTATLTLPPETTDAEFRKLTDALAVDPGITGYNPISRAAAEKELAVLLGEDASMIKDLPLARMVDVAFRTRARDEAPGLVERLRRAGVSAHVDPHDDFAKRLGAPAAQLLDFAITALAVIAATAALMVALVCGSSLAAHGEMVAVLRLIGARDGYIARIFERPLQINSFTGSALGTALAFAIVVWPNQTVTKATLELAPFLIDLKPRVDDWPSFVAIPLAFALIATLAARVAVAISLRRQER